MKDGKKNSPPDQENKSSTKQTELAKSNEKIKDLELPNSLNDELVEMLKKDKKRFFGGCGG
ncbi:MAG: hypothetical protein LC105_13470 [Chitinophagales bacterium]|nr:hypothetical protein [Chitinophagales bacterium]MCZ2394867.1 hypothetical protein [Chitinophagales bacterium]